MSDNSIPRLPRLVAIITQLQSKRLVTASEIAKKFGISVRTVYRDMRDLERAGIPVYTQEGKGYSLVDDYRLPPVMFSETEANALVTAEQLVQKNKDASFVKNYSEAILKIKSVLRHNAKVGAELLSDRIVFRVNEQGTRTSEYLSALQLALTSFFVVKLTYFNESRKEKQIRTVEPFAMYNTQENWLLVAFCRLRKDFRTFRLDRIEKMETLDKKFAPHKITLSEYFEICRQKSFLQPLT